MQLTGEQIIENNIITKFSGEAVQQQGVDVRLDRLFRLDDEEIGKVPEFGKTRIPKTIEIKPDDNLFILPVGYYEVMLEEGCDIPANAAMKLHTRSSLVRCGALVHSGQFDAGFKTDQMGCFLQVLRPIEIERGARIAQAIVSTTSTVKNLYDGQWQGDIQRQ